ncbi:MAG: ABC transporter permease [Vicinamibacterales bacterium]
MSMWSRIRNVFRADLNDDIDAELQSHFDEAHAAGRDPLEITRAFGPRLRVRETVRDATVAVPLESLLLDLRQTLRQLRRSPVFTATAVLTLALGIGGTTAIFTLIQQVMLRALPVARPQELWRIGDAVTCCYSTGYTQGNHAAQNDWTLFSWEAYQRFRADTPAFEDLAAFQIGTGNGELAMRRAGSAAPVEVRLGEYISGNFFRTFGVSAWRGRVFNDHDDVEGAPPVAVMSFHTWREDYGSDLSVVGATYQINGQPLTVIGVAPPGFFGAKVDASGMPDLWLPLTTEPRIAGATSRLKNPGVGWLNLIGRVRPGTNPQTLEAQLQGELRQWLASHRADMSPLDRSLWQEQTLHLTPGGAGVSPMREHYQDGLRLLLLAAVCVLLLACANVANLLLARGWRHRHEIAMRVAIGASRGRVVREALIGSAVLGILGGVVGIAVAYAGARLILQLAFSDAWVPFSAAPSTPVLCFAVAVAIITGLLFGAAPAWTTSHADPMDAMRGSNRTARGTTSAQKVLVIVQAAVSVVLLSAAAMLGQSLRNLEHRDLGFAVDGRYLVTIDPKLSNYPEAQLLPLFQEMETRLRAVPGVEMASAALYGPLGDLYWAHDVRIAGRPEPGARDDVSAAWTRVMPGFFETIGDRIAIGRPITDADNAAGRLVAVVNDAFARKFFPGENPIGRHFGPAPRKNAGTYEIVGVAADVHYFASTTRAPEQPMYFVPEAQTTTFDDRELQSREVWSHYLYEVVVWAPGNPPALAGEVRAALAAVDPNLVVHGIEPYSEVVRGHFAQQNMIASLTGLFGAIGLLLAAVGLYGVTAYGVEQRTGEIGVRMALGADRASITAMVLRGAFLQVGSGLALGVPVAIGAGLLMASQLFGVTPWDPMILSAAPVLLVLAALIAAAIPARRAASVDPSEALRAE